VIQAIFGLVGVVVGGLITGAVAQFARARVERAEVRAACRVLDLELLWLESFAEQAADGKATHDEALVRWQRTSDLWQGQRSILARVLDEEEWNAFAPKLVGFDVDFATFPDPEDDPEETRLWWGTIAADAAEARSAIRERL
jgi:hypothetical protein